MIRTSAVGRVWFGGTAVVVAAALALQMVLSAGGQPYSVFDSAGERLANLFAYFTILSNVLVGATFGVLAVRTVPSSRLLRVLHLDAVLGIAVTGIVYNLVLAPLDDLTGAAWVANLLLHGVVPVMAVLGWLVFGPRGTVDTPTVLLSTGYPLAWLAFTLVRGAVVDWSPFPAWYPYPFVDVGALGYARVTLNCCVIAVLFLGLAFGARALDRFLVRRFHPDTTAAAASTAHRPTSTDATPADPAPTDPALAAPPGTNPAVTNPAVTNLAVPNRAGSDLLGPSAPGGPAAGLRVGVQLQPQHADYGRIREAVAQAEEAGVDIVFNWDHFFPVRGAADGKHFECWTMLGAWAEATSRVEIGALVTCNGYRNPELLADMARTVDHISAGRLILGLGAGWFRRDFDEYGYDFGTAESRLAGLADALPRIRDRWTRLNPPPTRDIPILVGGGGEKRTLRCAAEHADIWHGFGDAGTIAHKSRVLDAHCADVGRDPRAIVRSAGVQAAPDAVADDLLAAGVGLVTIGVGGPDYDLGLLRDWIAWRDTRRA